MDNQARKLETREEEEARLLRAWRDGTMPSQQPPLCVGQSRPPPSTDARGYFIPHLPKMRPDLGFDSHFWTTEQFYTQGRSSMPHMDQISKIPLEIFQQIRRICLDTNITTMLRMDYERKLAPLEDIVRFCLTKGHPDLIIKVLVHTVLSEPGCTKGIHQYCWDVTRCDTGGCEYSYEPAEMFLMFQDEFRRRFEDDRVLFVPRIAWIKCHPSSIAFEEYGGYLYEWKYSANMYRIDLSVI